MTRRGLGWALAVLGTIALVFGGLGVLTGASGVLDGGKVSANVDSELRFYAAWYAVAGVVMLGAARHVERDGRLVRAVCAAFFIAACGRVIALVTVGAPHPLFLALMAAEFAIPAIVVPWQAAVARGAVPGPRSSEHERVTL